MPDICTSSCTSNHCKENSCWKEVGDYLSGQGNYWNIVPGKSCLKYLPLPKTLYISVILYISAWLN